VDQNSASEKSEGTAASPWKTLKEAAEMLQPGDICWIRSGDYRETLRPARSGTAAQPIVYKAAPGATVRINGCDELPASKSWTAWGNTGKVYQTSIELPLKDGDQVFLNRSMLIEARWPNVGTEAAQSDKWLLESALAVAAPGTDRSALQFTLPVSSYDQSVNPTGARIWVTPYPHQGWCNYTAKVDAFNASVKTLTCSLAAAIPERWEKCKVSVGENRYYLSGLLGFLDSQKEYFYDRGAETLYLYRADGTVPPAGSVEYKVRQAGIDLRGRSHIRVEGLKLFGCGLLSDDQSAQIVLERLEARYISHWGSAVCHGQQPASVAPTGIQLFGSGMELRNSVIDGSWGNGVDVRGKENTVLNNRILNCNYFGLYYASVNVSGTGHFISYNTVLRSGRSLLGGSFQRVQITHNEMGYANMVSADGACIYLGWADGGNSEIAYNYLHNSGGEARLAVGFYLDSNSYNFLFHHNLTEGVHLGSDGSHIVVAQNTIFGRGIQRVGIGNESKYGWIGTYLVNNICVPNIDYVGITRSVVQPAYESLNHLAMVHGNPLYNQNSDLASAPRFGTLQAGSPAINRGARKLDGLHDNVTDHRPDLGAFEDGQAPWTFGQDLNVNRSRNYSQSQIHLTNRLRNGGFEEDLGFGWTIQGRADRAWGADRRDGGIRSAKLEAGAAITQTLSGLRPNTKYVLSGWCRIGGTGKATLSVSGHGGAGVSANKVGNNSDTWFFNELAFQTGSNATAATVSLKNAGSTVICWDQAGVHWDFSGEGECSPESPLDLVINRGFEYGVQGWMPYAAVLEQTQSEKKAGAASMKVSGRTGAWAGPQVGLSLAKDKRYKFSAWLKLPVGSAPRTFTLRLQLMRQNAVTLHQPVVSAVIGTSWTKIEGEYAYTEASPITNALMLFASDGSQSDYFLDDVSVVPVNTQPPGLQTPVVNWPRPAAVVYGTALSATQCKASTTVPGTWGYQPSIGTVLAAGTHTLGVTFTPADPTKYRSVSATTTLEVTKKPLTITAQNASRAYGASNPVFAVAYSGLIPGESATALSGSLGFDCAAQSASAPGSYSITPRGLSSSNYQITFRPGSLTVTKAGQTLSFSIPDTRTIPQGPLPLVAAASSGLTVQFTSSNSAVARVSGSQLVVLKPGTVRITATQPGNANYLAASSVVRSLEVLAGQPRDQSIRFDVLPVLIEGAAPVVLSAQASSGLAVTFVSSNTNVARVQGNKLTVVGPGAAQITASQAGSAIYAPCSASQTLTVIPSAELVRNGGFESGVAPWYAFACTATLTQGRSPGGKALQVTRRTQQWGSCGQQVAMKPGRDYRVRAWVKNSGSVVAQGAIYVTLYLPNGQAQYQTLAPAQLVPNQWVKLEQTISLPETLPVQRAQISLVTPGSMASFIADDFSVCDLSLVAVPALTNASFESPNVSGGSVTQPQGAGWMFQGDAGICGSAPTAGNPRPAQKAFLRGAGVVGQNMVGLGVGQFYQILFDAAVSRLPAGARPQIEVRIGGQLIGSIEPGTTLNTFETPVFRATAATVPLELRAKNLQGSDTVYLDALEVVLAPLP
jgi:hypothetical protein